MSTDTQNSHASNMRHNEAVIRISESLAVCREPEKLPTILAGELNDFLSFDDLDLMILKENSTEIEWHVSGKGRLWAPDMPVEELPAWHVYDSQEPLLITDWKTDQRFPRLKQLFAEMGVELGSVIRVPLTTPYRRLGTLGISSGPSAIFGAEHVDLLCRIARVAAFAMDDAFNLRKARKAQAELKSQNARLELLLNLTKRITSNLDLRDLLRTISSQIREVIDADGVAVSLPDARSGKFRIFAIDFPQGKEVREELLVAPTASGKEALDSLQPVVMDWRDERDQLACRGCEVSELYNIMIGKGLKARCVIPLVNHGRALGLLSITRTLETSFTPDDVELLAQAAGQIAIAIENALAYREISELKDKLVREKLYLEDEIRSEMGFENIIGNSPALRHVLELVETVAPSDSTVLLLGETGTGKELIARAIHDRSRRKTRTFVKLNCAAIPTGLLESELFGHEKGAFTGAISQKIGRMELADQGTLFLDEVGDIPLEIQPKLLRALQEREFERLGGTHTRKVNVRLIAATNRELEKMIAGREFRSDLYYRLNVFPIRIPPLRDRREDIPLLVSHFVQKIATRMQKKIDSIPVAVMRVLAAWNWPGNIRELENFIERAVILTRGNSLEAPLAELRKPELEEPCVYQAAPEREQVAVAGRGSGTRRNAVANEYVEKQREEIIRTLTACNGRVGGADGAAARLGIKRTTLLTRMKKLNIYAKQYA